ncbi:MAG: hypothetical protein GEU81_03615 [Nitriliruptorales bacterium]|nr:hypothetical protein [Nitriliruptorales bacterium]
MPLKLLPARPRAGRAEARALPRRLVALAAGTALLVGMFFAGRATAPATVVRSAPVEEEPLAAEAEEGPGPADTVNGVAVGYTRTEEGAVAAATGYLAAIGDKRAFNRQWREGAYRVIAAPEVYEDLVESVEASYERIEVDLGLGDAAAYDGSILAVTVPLGYRVESFNEDRATIVVWAAGWLTRPSGQQLPLRAQANAMELAWVDDDWKLTGVSGSQPLDPPGVTIPPDAQIVAEMAQFNSYHHRPQEP